MILCRSGTRSVSASAGHRGQQTLFDCPTIDLGSSKVAGAAPKTPLVASAFPYCQATESWAWPGYETRKRSVTMLCPGIGCALPTPLLKYMCINPTDFNILQSLEPCNYV